MSILSLLDLSAAFDTLDHHIMLQRLSLSFGLSGTVLKWFSSYLTGRHFFVIIDGIKSDLTPLEFGVPQGSVLGPMLYTLYTLPLGNVIRQHLTPFHMYADDTCNEWDVTVFNCCSYDSSLLCLYNYVPVIV